MAAIVSVVNGWSLLVTLVGGSQYPLSGNDARTCDALPKTVAVAYFDFSPSAGASRVEFYTGVGCGGSKKTGYSGHTDSNPDLIYQSYKVLA